mmetsp:Transcript_132581/g.424232  ORF Transcript_132581/g.424232 Transcript_132581/m.424232 type:complete len:548 (+) Transcript_132581:146-1789(+)
MRSTDGNHLDPGHSQNGGQEVPNQRPSSGVRLDAWSGTYLPPEGPFSVVGPLEPRRLLQASAGKASGRGSASLDVPPPSTARIPLPFGLQQPGILGASSSYPRADAASSGPVASWSANTSAAYTLPFNAQFGLGQPLPGGSLIDPFVLRKVNLMQFAADPGQVLFSGDIGVPSQGVLAGSASDMCAGAYPASHEGGSPVLPGVENPTAPLYLKQFHQTKMCAFFQKGRCKLGDKCRFAHSRGEVQQLPDLAQTQLCENFLRGSGTFRPPEGPFSAVGPLEPRRLSQASVGKASGRGSASLHVPPPPAARITLPFELQRPGISGASSSSSLTDAPSSGLAASGSANMSAAYALPRNVAQLGPDSERVPLPGQPLIDPLVQRQVDLVQFAADSGQVLFSGHLAVQSQGSLEGSSSDMWAGVYPATSPEVGSPVEVGVQNPAVPLYLKQFHKTKMCAFFQKGKCKMGERCRFAHLWDELLGVPDLMKTKLCVSFLRGSCTDDSCIFAHGYQELRSTGGVYKTALCRWRFAGWCNAGESCRYAHTSDELRS